MINTKYWNKMNIYIGDFLPPAFSPMIPHDTKHRAILYKILDDQHISLSYKDISPV